ncbi:interference hedgehog [Manduca sexta]|uniref:Interference hedgehog n=1 Tax=Manduca sexta TaxID=7130 RepID=A0A921YNA0_MANSE|nr:interference hedgehog [Manduca sexta]KAG6442423.1 hypothetical protein O3G_MSEX002349 [Manduca sexta]
MAMSRNIPFLLIAILPITAEIYMNFTKNPESVTAPVGDSVTFECEVNVPPEKLVWRSRLVDNPEGSWVQVGTSKELETGSAAKLVVEVTKDTVTSFYQCVVFYGSVILVSIPARLSVARVDLSENSGETRVITAPLHNTIVLHCKEPKSDPPAILNWWKEEGGVKKQLDTPHGVLVIHNATAGDSGTYGCRATNEISSQVLDLPERTHLKVQHGGNRDVRFLESEEYVGVKDSEGILTMPVHPNGTLRLWCGAVGSPPPRITWSREQRSPLPQPHDDPLNVSSFTADHEGIYSCSANGIRRAWKVVQLQPPRWEGSVEDLSATEGGNADINCGSAVGYPHPTVHWVLNGEVLKSEKGIQATDSDLHIDHLEKRHAGIVQCFACNKLGCTYLAAMLTVVPLQISDQDYSAEMPKASQSSSQPPKKHYKKNSKKNKNIMIPPSRPNVTRLSDQSVMVSWSHAKEGLPIRFFKVQYKEATNASNAQWNTATLDIPPHIHSYEIEGLSPDKYYKFRIAAVYSNQDNKQGRSSARFLLQRGAASRPAAPAAPALLRALATSPHTIQLNWTWSRGSGVEAEGFYVYYRVQSTAGPYTKVSAPESARSLSLHHLAPDTRYEVKIQAYTAQAPSEFSSIVMAITHKGAESTNIGTGGGSAFSDSAGGGTEEPRRGTALVPAAAALGAALLLAAAVAVLLCWRAKRHPPNKENGSAMESPGSNGYIPAKVPITITANPMHSEGSEPGVEMSFLHNNNTGNNDDTLPHSRKNGPAPRQYV